MRSASCQGLQVQPGGWRERPGLCPMEMDGQASSMRMGVRLRGKILWCGTRGLPIFPSGRAAVSVAEGLPFVQPGDVLCFPAAPASICKIHRAAPAPRLGAHGAVTSRGTQQRNFRAPGGGAEEPSLQRCVPVGTTRPRAAHPSVGAATRMESLRAPQRSGGPLTEQRCVRLCNGPQLRQADFLQ